MSVFLGVLIAVAIFGAWRSRSRARKGKLAGLTSVAPVFSVEPPARRVGNLKGERL